MFVVALVTLGTAADVEQQQLAADLGITVYDAGLVVRAPLPVILMRTDDRARALDLLGKLRARGHEAVAFDGAAVASSDQANELRSFRIEPDAIVVLGVGGVLPIAPGGDRLPFADVIALVRAVHQTRVDSVETTTSRKISLGRAALTGGVLATKTVTKEKARASEDRDPVLYLFRAGGPPWLVASSRARYDALGPEMRPSQIENFNTLVRILRERAPHAPYDERLLAVRPGMDRIPSVSATKSVATSASAVDLLAHVVAMSVSRRPSG